MFTIHTPPPHKKKKKRVYLKFPNNIVSTEALILAYINCTSACLENQAYDRKHKTVLGKTTP